MHTHVNGSFDDLESRTKHNFTGNNTILNFLFTIEMRRSAFVVAFLAIPLVILFACYLYFSGTIEFRDEGNDYAPPEPTHKPGSVVLVTTASSGKLNDFKDVDNFYQKLWDNRMSYAVHHSMALFQSDS
jgi:hypothetical protein